MRRGAVDKFDCPAPFFIKPHWIGLPGSTIVLVDGFPESGFGVRTMDPRKTFRVPLRVVFYRESGSWIAHCLEFDLVGDGQTKADALGCLSDAVVLQVEASLAHNNMANLFTPADGKYLEMYAAGHDISAGMLEITEIVERLKLSSPVIEGVETRQYDDSEAGHVFA
jgi:hypothetical protein